MQRNHPSSIDLEYDPHEGQRPFHEDRYGVKFRAAFAGTGAGKTLSGAAEALAVMLENPGVVGAAYEPEFPMVTRNLLPAFGSRWLLDGPIEESPIVAEYNRTEHRIRLWNGSVLWFGSLKDPTRAEGQNLDFVWVDEPRLVRYWDEENNPDSAWPTLRRRLRGTGALPDHADPMAWVTSSAPTRELHNFFEGSTSTRNARVYRWATGENPHLSLDYVRDVAQAHTGSAYERFILGKWTRAEGLVFEMWDPEEHVREAIPKDTVDYYTGGVDWGWTNPAALIFIAWRGDRAHVVDEVYGSHMRTSELIRRARELEEAWGQAKWFCGHDDPEAIERFKSKGLNAESYGTRKKKPGIRHMIDKIQGRELYVDPECAHLLEEIDTYAWEDEEDEEPEDGNDHSLDASRYAITGPITQGIRRARAWG